MRTFLNNYNDVLCIILRCENELQLVTIAAAIESKSCKYYLRVNTIGIIYSTNEIWLCISSLWQQPWLLSNKSILITKFVEPDILAKKFINLFPYCFNKHTTSWFLWGNLEVNYWYHDESCIYMVYRYLFLIAIHIIAAVLPEHKKTL